MPNNSTFNVFNELATIGLFSNLSGETNQDKFRSLQKNVNKFGEETWDEFIERLRNVSELERYLSVVSYSEQTRSYDMEADVCEENSVYCELLSHLTKLSKGEFTVSDAKEDWGNVGKKTVGLSFVWQDKRIVWELEYFDDWIDPHFFENFRNFTKENLSGEFLYFKRDDWHTVMVLWLTKEQSEVF